MERSGTEGQPQTVQTSDEVRTRDRPGTEERHPAWNAPKHRKAGGHKVEMTSPGDALMADYIALIHKERDSDYGVSFPDFPGCITAGRTLDEASRMAAEALAFHIQGLVEDGEAVPEPSKVDDIAADAARRGAIAFMVRIDAPDATVRVNITARQSQIA